ncbi:uncharacterized protein Z518_10900 [Rhinocladiella mackenziei CBS 650.93]|uniref:Uncharacterized protein n=1 Tax=Rhinocladiella mackenziei CBS 650.93 TaxID=1442369 RepID=A0A0D2GNP6_9EURO|nr:uncharacterized protein Z518_10900 [Rhinocladiella mackenziei CBS 650.93]KIW99972.1 hypothetical protein Z518_10900 [Rhinocladiella mackenziei CBS 650.93]
MDVMSVESCVQAVIGAYRDASKLVLRLKDKQKKSEEFILPEHLTKDFEDSLSLGCVAVQSQYDHDVRRFGETYARGDSTAREQMKDILITLQQVVITHLREVYMDEAALDLHTLRETSDDSRVNATVCLGQLYQRMSTATAAMKQISRPYLDEPDKTQLPGSLAYSSSRSTHSSFGTRPLDNQSATSYSTYSSRTAVGHDRKPSGGLTPQRRISMNSSFSNSSERDQSKGRTPGEDSVPALPPPMQRQPSQNAVDSTGPSTGSFQQRVDRAASPHAGAPPPYKSSSPAPTHVIDEKGQNFPPESSFYQPPTADVRNIPQPSPPPQRSPGFPGETGFSRPVPLSQVHELDNGSRPEEQQPRDQGTSTRSPQIGQHQTVPLNPDYSTLEYVAALDARSRPPAALASSPLYQQYTQQIHPQEQSPMQYGYQYQHQQQHRYQHQPQSLSHPQPQSPPQTMVQNFPPQNQAVSRPHTSATGTSSESAPVDPVLIKPPTVPAESKPLSIRSSSSTGSKIGSFALRKALPPGIAKAIHRPAPSPLEARLNSQPRYVKPPPLDLNNGQTVQVASLTSPIAQHVDRASDEVPDTSASNTPSLDSTMRAPASPHLQVAGSELNLPSESNLAGFCKGAVRQQLGTRKKGFSLEHKKGAKGADYFFRCTKCNFEGPAAVSTALPSGGRGAAKREKTFDSRVRVSEGGIKYRWVFLAKSHVLNKANHSDLNNGNDVFACYFCCAEGAAKGWVDDNMSTQLATLGTFGDKKPTAIETPTFHGLQAFMAHLDTHRIPSRTPGLIVANEMNCIVGRVAHDSEDFDLNLPPMKR